MAEKQTVEIDVDDLGWLVACAVRYDTRLPYGQVPGHIWTALPPKWREAVAFSEIPEGAGDREISLRDSQEKAA